MYERIDLAIYRGKKNMRERVSHKRILSELRWESQVCPCAVLRSLFFAISALNASSLQVYYDPMSFEGPPKPEELAFPPSIVQLISSFE